MQAISKGIALLAMGAIAAFGTADATGKPNDDLVFSGQVIHAAGHEVFLYVNDKKIAIGLADDGHFSDTLALASGHYRFMDDAKNRLTIYFERGKDLHFTYDAADFNATIRFSGKGAAINDYLSRKEALKVQIGKAAMTDSISTLFQLDEPLFRQVYLDVKEACLRALSATDGISAEYRLLETRNIHYEYLHGLNQYGRFHRTVLKKADFGVSGGFAAELDTIDYTDRRDFLFSASYGQLIQGHHSGRAAGRHAAEGIPLDVATLQEFAAIEDPFIKDSLLFKFAVTYIAHSADLEGFYAAFLSGSTNESHKRIMGERYRTLKSVAPGSPSPKFVGYENFAGGTSSLDDFKGTYVFIDIWATWCGPCVYEFPYLDELEDAYRGKNIRFITLSIDTKANREKWRAFVAEKALDGIQLLADNAFESGFVQAYNITAIPRFLLIDPQGNIVSNNAPRPSSPQLKALLDGLPLISDH